MRTVFADTGYWIAVLNPGDGLHRRAETVAEQLAPFRIVTTEMVLVEVLDSVSSWGHHVRELAAKNVKAWLSGPEVDVVPHASDRFRAALDRYASRLDQDWSLTDCASFLVMEEMNIPEALAEDHNFEQAGFIALLRPPNVVF